MVAAALAKVPELDPTDIDDLMLGCGLPGGEQGFNMARVVAILLGYDHLPGTTLTRYCASSVQTSRMAFHAIKAGEGDVFVSAGVETVSRYANGSSDCARHSQPGLRRRRRANRGDRAETDGEWHDPRADGLVPDIYMPMGQTAENLAQSRGISRRELDEFGVRSQNLAEKAIADGFWAREITPSPCPTAPSSRPTTAHARRDVRGGRRSSSRYSGPTASSRRATAARSTTARPPS